MALIDRLWLATSTRNEDNSGTGARKLNLTVNIDGEDVLDKDFRFSGTGGGRSADSFRLSRSEIQTISTRYYRQSSGHAQGPSWFWPIPGHSLIEAGWRIWPPNIVCH